MKLLVASSHISKFFNPMILKSKDRKRFLKSQNPSLDFKTSRTLISFHKTRQKYCISHKNGHSAILFGKGKIGVDMEEMKERSNLEELLHLIAKEEELKSFYTLKKQEQICFFYELFTLKESLIKLHSLNLAKIQSISTHHISYPPLSLPCKSYGNVSLSPHTPLLSQTKTRAKNGLFAYFWKTKIENRLYMICCVISKKQ